MMRLDKFLSEMQKGSRNQVKTYIKNGRVKVNDRIIKTPDLKIDENQDIIQLDDVKIEYSAFEYYMLNKPSGVVSATTDRTEKTVLDFLPSHRKDLFPVGRLDKDTEGLLLITNDGLLAHKLLSPKNHIDKTYFAKVRGQINEHIAALFTSGFYVDAQLFSLPAVLTVLNYDEMTDISTVHVTIQEGKFHQIKRMFKAVDSEVLYLKRISMGLLKLDTALKLGQYRPLTQKEIAALKKL